MAKAEEKIRAYDGRDHRAHISKRKDNKAAEAEGAAKRLRNGVTAASLASTGASLVPAEVQKMIDNQNQEVLDLDGNCSKTDLIAELKARPEAYAKIPTYKTGNNAGEPNGSAAIPVLKAALKAANGGKGVVVRKAGEVGSAAIPRFNRG